MLHDDLTLRYKEYTPEERAGMLSKMAWPRLLDTSLGVLDIKLPESAIKLMS